MKTITKNKWFLLLLGFLFMANIALLLSFFVFGERSDPDKNIRSNQSGQGYLSKELALTKEQDIAFNKLKEEHFKTMKPLWSDIRKTKDSFFRQMNNPAMDDSTIADFAGKIAQKNKLADELMFRHFRELRKICSPQQQQKFDTIIPQMFSKSYGRSHSGKK